MSHARITDPDTSHAAVPDDYDLNRLCLRTLRAFARAGRPMIAHEAGVMAGFDCHQRCSDLLDAGFLERCGKDWTPSGKKAYLHRITPSGYAYLAVTHGL